MPEGGRAGPPHYKHRKKYRENKHSRYYLMEYVKILKWRDFFEMNRKMFLEISKENVK